LSASTSLNMLTAAAVKFNLSGWEVFTGVPASFGGAIFMNAGTRLGEIGDLIKSIKVLRFSGEIVNIQKDKESFSYRKNNFAGVGDVILSAVIKHNGFDESISQKIKDYMVHRKSTQPIASKTCGCVFKNYSPELPAGKAIDVLGLRGMSYKGIEISDKHCNFFENKKEAKVESFLELSSFVTEQLERYYGVEFELEVKI
jgi:UDP-N-acetylmuramate dehydrogenase